jgi:phosphoribosylamine--glycine ligase
MDPNRVYDVLLIGSGGREHAILNALLKSDYCGRIHCAPGNAGTNALVINVPAQDLDIKDHAAVIRFCKEQYIDLVVVGPEDPLVAGIADDLRKAGILVFGPGKFGAQIESSKWWAKQLMAEYGIPTAAGRMFTTEQLDDAISYLRWCCANEKPQVIKADGLCAGKGVIVPETLGEAVTAIQDILGGKFKEAGRRIVIEDRMTGRELSIMIITDGKKAVFLPAARDHKRLHDGDVGPNTGGMGAYAPVPDATDEILKQVAEKIATPLLKALHARGLNYRGVIYLGLMICDDGVVRVVEFNCRFGDPETQVVLPLLKSDLLTLLMQAADGILPADELEIYDAAAVCVIMASDGYGEKSKIPTGYEIRGLEDVAAMDDVIAFHAGTAMSDEGEYLTSGGRVLGITAVRPSHKEARDQAYMAVKCVAFTGRQFRTDIARDVAE